MSISVKKAAAAAAAVVMLLSAGVSTVSAADYARDVYQVKNQGSSSSTGVGNPSGEPGASGLQHNPEISGIVYPNDLRQGQIVKIPEDGAILLPETIAKMARDGGSYSFRQVNGVTMTIDGASVTSTSVPKKIGVKVIGSKKANALKVTFLTDEHDFGMTISVRIPKKVCDKVGLDTKSAAVMYVPDSGSPKKDGSLTRNGDGSISLACTHASYYLIASDATFDAALKEKNIGGLFEDVSAGASVDEYGIVF